METTPSAPRPARLWRSKADFFRPFRAAASEAEQTITPLYDPGLQRMPPDQPDLHELNASLTALADLFPDVQPEVFRDMLISISDESRLQLVTEQLLQGKAKRVHGRWITSRKELPAGTSTDLTAGAGSRSSLPAHDLFRSESYKKAVKTVFYQEFRNLSHSTIKGVLAEQNFSYNLARPILQNLAARSWRFSFTSLWSKKSPALDTSWHPFVIWQPDGTKDGQFVPAIKRTGDTELDHELYELFVISVTQTQSRERIRSDFAIASELNEEEAMAAEALFDCECCYGSVTFEEITVCDDGGHFLCLDCIRRAVNEALYGQGWSSTANLETGTVHCFASASQTCHGNLDQDSLHRALDKDIYGPDLWKDFQSRMTNEVLLRSGLSLHRCPFCNYAEVDELPPLNVRYMLASWANEPVKTGLVIRIAMLVLMVLVSITMVPFFGHLTALALGISTTPTVQSLLKTSWSRVYKGRRSLRFKCQDPSCLSVSCSRCSALWTDPHVCFDSKQTSLRTAVEASATAAIKRTCPKCMLSFVKSSGCNKLVCNCGYTMCYICRQEITSKEGYAHFCQHFRPNGGRCAECDRCDLYGDEDEDLAIRAAVEAAEKAWTEKEGGRDVDEEANRALINAMIGRTQKGKWHERWLDVAVNAFVMGH